MNYREIVQDLFKVDSSYALAHCISKDAAMGAGIAREFRRRYPEMPEFVRLANPNVGDAVLYQSNGPVIFNLVTKEKYWHKPTYETFTNCVKSLKDEMKKHNICKLAIPKIGAGLDRLNWEKNRKLIKQIFADADVEIIVCLWN